MILEFHSSTDRVDRLADWDAAIAIAEARNDGEDTSLSSLLAEARKRRTNAAVAVSARDRGLKNGLAATFIPPLVVGLALVLIFWTITGFRQNSPS